MKQKRAMPRNDEDENLSGMPKFQFKKFRDELPSQVGAYLIKNQKSRHPGGMTFPGVTFLSFAAINAFSDELCFYHEIDGRIVRVSDNCWAKSSWCYLGWKAFGQHGLFVASVKGKGPKLSS